MKPVSICLAGLKQRWEHTLRPEERVLGDSLGARAAGLPSVL